MFGQIFVCELVNELIECAQYFARYKRFLHTNERRTQTDGHRTNTRLERYVYILNAPRQNTHNKYGHDKLHQMTEPKIRQKRTSNTVRCSNSTETCASLRPLCHLLPTGALDKYYIQWVPRCVWCVMMMEEVWCVMCVCTLLASLCRCRPREVVVARRLVR